MTFHRSLLDDYQGEPVNPLDQYPQIRKALYLAQWVISLVTGALGVVFTAKGNVPDWFVITLSVLAFVWAYTGITAQSNTDSTATPGPQD